MEKERHSQRENEKKNYVENEDQREHRKKHTESEPPTTDSHHKKSRNQALNNSVSMGPPVIKPSATGVP